LEGLCEYVFVGNSDGIDVGDIDTEGVKVGTEEGTLVKVFA